MFWTKDQNEALRQHIQPSRGPLEVTLRRVVREELELNDADLVRAIAPTPAAPIFQAFEKWGCDRPYLT